MYDGLDEHSPSKELIDTCWNVNPCEIIIQ